MELQQVFGIFEPLNAESADRIFDAANEKLQNISVSTLLKQYKVEFVATTDDPCDDLLAHGKYGGTIVAPTFRPDKLFTLDEAYLQRLGETAGEDVSTLAGALKSRRKAPYVLHFPRMPHLRSRILPFCTVLCHA